IQQAGHRNGAPLAAAAVPCRQRECGRDQQQGKGEHGHTGAPGAGLQSDPRRRSGQIGPARTRRHPARLTGRAALLNILRLMSAELPEILDAWRMVATRREFEGRAALSALPRLRDALSDAEGEVEFALAFDHDAMRVPYLELKLDAELPLQCQR